MITRESRISPKRGIPWPAALSNPFFDVLAEPLVSDTKPPMSAPAGNLGGRWDVNVKFLSSVSQHMFTRQQDGNKVQGSHKGDLSVRDIFGTIDSDQVKLRSAERVPGDQIIYTFAGTLSGDTISGEVYMGEYLNAKFTARPHTYPSETGAIVIPGGPPLAN